MLLQQAQASAERDGVRDLHQPHELRLLAL
jgi:hypothetical protein